jgi:hypothetical protein
LPFVKSVAQDILRPAGGSDGVSTAPALDTAAAVIALALLLGCEPASPLKSLKAIRAMPTNAIEAAICIGNLV